VENGSKIIGIYGGGFKPPTKGHFEVVQQALKQFPEMDELIIYVGSGERDKVDQAESVLVWNIYKKHLPSKVSVESVKAPVGDIFRYAKDHPEEKIYFILGAREGSEGDIADNEARTKSVSEKYPNIEVKIINTSDVSISGTNARKALFQSRDAFFKYVPDVLSSVEKERVYTLLVPELINENASYAKDIDYKQYIKELTKDMIRKGMNVTPLPKVIFKHDDVSNAKDFFGKTAYYEPQSMSIVLYTEGRHPKDIVRSFAHEMIHHMQNVEGRLGNITTTNTQEDDHLNDLEAEANLKGTMTFRNWTDKMQERKNKDPFGITAYALELARGLEEELIKNPSQYIIYCDMDGVLCDFDGQFEKYYNISPRSISNEELVKAVDAKGVEFWSEMKWMKGGEKIWSMISSYNPSLLTSPGKFKYAEEGKKIWVANNLSPQPKDIIFAQSRNKHIILSGKSPEDIANSILIDDYYPNVAPWKKAGGIVAYNTPAGKAIRVLYALGFK
jgi:cytidyltransferase-like protein